LACDTCEIVALSYDAFFENIELYATLDVFLSKIAEGCSLLWQVSVSRPVMVLRAMMVHMATCCCFFENIEMYATLGVFVQKS
jgi:hypothetical protein